MPLCSPDVVHPAPASRRRIRNPVCPRSSCEQSVFPGKRRRLRVHEKALQIPDAPVPAVAWVEPVTHQG